MVVLFVPYWIIFRWWNHLYIDLDAIFFEVEYLTFAWYLVQSCVKNVILDISDSILLVCIRVDHTRDQQKKDEHKFAHFCTRRNWCWLISTTTMKITLEGSSTDTDWSLGHRNRLYTTRFMSFAVSSRRLVTIVIIRHETSSFVITSLKRRLIESFIELQPQLDSTCIGLGKYFRMQHYELFIIHWHVYKKIWKIRQFVLLTK